MNRVAGELITDKNRVVLVNAPEKEGITVPTEAELTAVFAAVSQKEITPYEDAVSEEPLIAAPPDPGTGAEAPLALQPRTLSRQAFRKAYPPMGTNLAQCSR